MKGSVIVGGWPVNLEFCARLWMDAGASACSIRRGGDGRIPRHERAFDRSVTDFSERYADQNERDYQAFTAAVASGRLEAIEGV
jgi:hypothetical protein